MKSLALGLVVLTMLAMSNCRGQEQSSAPTTPTPAPMIDREPGGPHQPILFHVRAFDKNGNAWLGKNFLVSISAVKFDGHLARVFDKNTHLPLPNPVTKKVSTPYNRVDIYTPGIAILTYTVTYFGAAGDRVVAWAQEGDREIDRQDQTVQPVVPNDPTFEMGQVVFTMVINVNWR